MDKTFLLNPAITSVQIEDNSLLAINDFIEEINTLWNHFKNNNLI